MNNVIGAYTGSASVPLAATAPPVKPRPKVAARPSLNDRILATHSRTPPPEIEAANTPSRPHPKIIEVRYPGGRQVAVARPAGAD